MAIINEYLNQFKGETISERIAKDCSKYLMEQKIKQNHYSQVALVSVLDPKTKEIKNLGGSIPSDIITDNLGEWLAIHCTQQTGLARSFPNIDTGGVVRTMNFNNLPNIYNNGGAQGSLIQLGSGTSVVARTDFKIETPFIIVPENGGISISALAFYDNVLNQITYNMNLIAGGSGTIEETASIQQWSDLSGVQRQILVAHDLISPAVAFVATQLIAVTYTWQI